MDSDSEQEIVIDTTDDEYSSMDSESDDGEILEDVRKWCKINVSCKLRRST